VIDPEYHYETVNVESQQENSGSLLWWHKRLIALRQRHGELFGRGSIEFVHPDNPKVLAYVRRHEPEDGPEQRVLVVANLSRNAQPATFSLSEYQGLSPVEMFGRTAFPAITDQPYLLTLGPYQFYWFSLEREPSRLSLSQMRESSQALPVEAPSEPPELTVAGDWTALLRGRGRERVEAVLPTILHRQRWFGGKAREILTCKVADVIDVGKKDDPALRLLIARVEYVEGEPEEYVLAVDFAEGEDAGRIAASTPNAILAHVKGRGQRGSNGILFDALHDPEVGAALLDTVARNRRFRAGRGELVGRRDRPLGSQADRAELEASVLKAEQSNTSIVFGERYMMKVVRRLERGVSPDVEIGRFLAGRVEHVPELLGTIDHVREDADEPATVAMLTRFVPNEGDAWVHTLDELERFSERVLSDPPDAGRTLPGGRAPSLELASKEIPEAVHGALGPYVDSAILLGQRTAELHVALAAGDGNEAFATEPFTTLYQRSLYQSMRNALRKGLQAARKGITSVPDPAARDHIEQLSAREDEILERLKTLSTTRIDAVRTRIHGDYHLGQVLWTGRDFVIIDFEGEPARPLGERRLKRSPLRDVAGMLRSYQYATASALRFQLERGGVTQDRAGYEDLRGWLAYWHRWASAAFLRGYLETAAGQPFLPSDPDNTAILLDAFLLEKAIYELGYEMNNRPEWVDIPLTGIAEVLGDA
jgi:maltose alpha-D-glucosyltransferase / alpha-amylase